ncbi:MAG: hypothetical protein JXQ27_11070 [Acidobacteria bacterium]|nr:hypothetical protein [Acidobacteriota bacterium]
MPQDRVQVPAIGMVVAAALDIMMALFFAALNILPFTVGGSQFPEFGRFSAGMSELIFASGIGLLLSVFALVMDGFIIFGAVRMRQLRSYGLAVAAAILSLIPCLSSPCFVLGVPFGIWSLVVLLNGEVRAAFRETPSAETL